LVADSHSILARWRNYFSKPLNRHGVNDARLAYIPTAEPQVTEPSASEVELAIEKIKSHKSPGVEQIPAELIKTGSTNFVMIFINLLFLFQIRKNCQRIGRSQS